MSQLALGLITESGASPDDFLSYNKENGILIHLKARMMNQQVH
jgi:hypothetical protein